MFDIRQFAYELLLKAPGILVGLTIHEYAHGLMALWRGDDTAKQAGRLSLNPVSHLDFYGTLMLCIGFFGWAKPVPVNYHNLHNPRWDSALVSVAGPVMNIVGAFVCGAVLRFFDFSILGSANSILAYKIVFMAYQINIGLSFFNLLPFPPLDGSTILMSFLPRSKIEPYLRLMRHVPLIFIVLFFIEWSFHIPTISRILNPLYFPFASFWNFVILGKGF
jgi:Zn-dependent protease